MTISTKDCKDFIQQIAANIGADSSQWKRTRKYKDNGLVLRDFANEQGRVLTIAEKDGSLFLYSLNAPAATTTLEQPLFGEGYQKFNRPVTEDDVFQFIAHCVKKDSSIVDEETDAVIDAINPSSWTVWERWNGNKSEHNNYDCHPLKDFFDGNDGSWGEMDLYYPDKEGDKLKVNPEGIRQVFWIGMSDYDTAYRIYIFESNDHELLLGCNNPD